MLKFNEKSSKCLPRISKKNSEWNNTSICNNQSLTQSMRYPQRAILRIVERQNLVFGFLNQHREPHRQIGPDHVHQSEASQNLVPVDFDLLQNTNQTRIVNHRRISVNHGVSQYQRRTARRDRSSHKNSILTSLLRNMKYIWMKMNAIRVAGVSASRTLWHLVSRSSSKYCPNSRPE